jgi:hypothetical protein
MSRLKRRPSSERVLRHTLRSKSPYSFLTPSLHSSPSSRSLSSYQEFSVTQTASGLTDEQSLGRWLCTASDSGGPTGMLLAFFRCSYLRVLGSSTVRMASDATVLPLLRCSWESVYACCNCYCIYYRWCCGLCNCVRNCGSLLSAACFPQKIECVEAISLMLHVLQPHAQQFLLFGQSE